MANAYEKDWELDQMELALASNYSGDEPDFVNDWDDEEPITVVDPPMTLRELVFGEDDVIDPSEDIGF